MESISSTSDYSSILENLLLSDVSQIRKSAMIQHATDKLDRASEIAYEISHPQFGEGYQLDSNIPEGSTFSLHV